MNKKRKYVCFALIALVLGFIWVNSMMPASVSGQMSSFIVQILRHIPVSVLHLTDKVIRKMAHAAEFCCLGILLALFFQERLKQRLPLIAFCGLAAAAIDETIQVFSDGRGSQLRDVWIDFAGFCAGVFVVCLFVRFRSKGKRARKQE